MQPGPPEKVWRWRAGPRSSSASPGNLDESLQQAGPKAATRPLASCGCASYPPLRRSIVGTNNRWRSSCPAKRIGRRGGKCGKLTSLGGSPRTPWWPVGSKPAPFATPSATGSAWHAAGGATTCIGARTDSVPTSTPPISIANWPSGRGRRRPPKAGHRRPRKPSPSPGWRRALSRNQKPSRAAARARLPCGAVGGRRNVRLPHRHLGKA